MDTQYIDINEFKFNSLRKHMNPIYWELRRNEDRPFEEKEEIARNLISRFFRRMREYRGVSIERIAKSSNHDTEMIQKFENGQIRSTALLEKAYCQECTAQHEQDYFNRRLFEFANPETREGKKDVALDLVRRFGILIPDVDFSRIKSPPADLIEFSPRNKNQSAEWLK